MRYKVKIYHPAVTTYEVEADSQRDAFNKAWDVNYPPASRMGMPET